MGRRYRRRSAAGSIISDSAYIGSRLPWWGALAFGILTFLLFYYIAPAWLGSKLSASEGSTFYSALEAIFGRRIHWFKWLGVACALIFGYFTVRNYVVLREVTGQERGIVGIIARILGRSIE